MVSGELLEILDVTYAEDLSLWVRSALSIRLGPEVPEPPDRSTYASWDENFGENRIRRAFQWAGPASFGGADGKG